MLLHHLIQNAIKFRKAGQQAEISIDIHRGNATEDNHNQAIPGVQYWRIGISDNGIGFDPELTATAFGIFTQLHSDQKHKASGIGPAVCRKIMELHDGFITVKTEPDKGSTFFCFFPID